MTIEKDPDWVHKLVLAVEERKYDTICEQRFGINAITGMPDSDTFIALTIKGRVLGFGSTEEKARAMAVSRAKLGEKLEGRDAGRTTEKDMERFCEDYEKILEAATHIAELQHPHVKSGTWHITDIDLDYVDLTVEYREACGCCYGTEYAHVDVKYLGEDGVELFTAELAEKAKKHHDRLMEKKARDETDAKELNDKTDRTEYKRLKEKFEDGSQSDHTVCL